MKKAVISFVTAFVLIVGLIWFFVDSVLHPEATWKYGLHVCFALGVGSLVCVAYGINSIRKKRDRKKSSGDGARVGRRIWGNREGGRNRLGRLER